jgi:hypothetical protein
MNGGRGDPVGHNEWREKGRRTDRESRAPCSPTNTLAKEEWSRTKFKTKSTTNHKKNQTTYRETRWVKKRTGPAGRKGTHRCSVGDPFRKSARGAALVVRCWTTPEPGSRTVVGPVTEARQTKTKINN